MSSHPSGARTGCCQHQKSIPKFHNHPVPGANKKSKKQKKPLRRPKKVKEKTPSLQRKTLYQLHNAWFHHTIKHHFLPWTGCSFDSQYERYTLKENSPYYYKKVRFNYHIVDDSSKFSKKMLEKQVKRRERTYRRCVSTCIKQNPTAINPTDGNIIPECLHQTMTQLKHLCLPNRSIRSPIKHLTRKKHGNNSALLEFLSTYKSIRRRTLTTIKNSTNIQ
ncbi:hypothetical protein RclHR1_11800006 [Rhizophagus clarus]|uniref:DUF8211 domain-containing protein n=1 Tax=Rhizophagus clarus TaxID=94130 RepID=A0A2Z6Q5F4_9GLOM|nr:hypothetical protein RclHR1_11800006 [Rhizophagus clarus]GES91793.1 hypothetical protein RCL_jg14033.t1 [Rhizophagus clarus]